MEWTVATAATALMVETVSKDVMPEKPATGATAAMCQQPPLWGSTLLDVHQCLSIVNRAQGLANSLFPRTRRGPR